MTYDIFSSLEFVVLVILSKHIERFSVSLMRDFFNAALRKCVYRFHLIRYDGIPCTSKTATATACGSASDKQHDENVFKRSIICKSVPKYTKLVKTITLSCMMRDASTFKRYIPMLVS